MFASEEAVIILKKAARLDIDFSDSARVTRTLFYIFSTLLVAVSGPSAAVCLE